MTEELFDTREKNEHFEKELSSLCNRYSLDAELNVPDFLIAEYLISHIKIIKNIVLNLDKWRTNDNENQ